MPKISKEKKDKISEHILSLLLEKFPKAQFTSHIAKEIARDEEFTKELLSNLKDQGLVSSIQKNSKGLDYLKRIRWRLSSNAYDNLKH